MDAWWRGDFPGGRLALPEDYSTLAVWLYAVVPPCNPYLYGVGEVRSKSNAVVVKTVAGSASALLFAKRIARAERIRATGGLQSFKQPSMGAKAVSSMLGEGGGNGSRTLLPTVGRFQDMIDVTFQNEEALQAEAAAREALDNQSRILSFYSIPATKLIVRCTIHLIFLANVRRLWSRPPLHLLTMPLAHPEAPTLIGSTAKCSSTSTRSTTWRSSACRRSCGTK